MNDDAAVGRVVNAGWRDMKVLRRALAVVLPLVIGCGESGTGPETGQVTFPPIDPGILTGNCIRGTAVPPANRLGNISEVDCSTVATNVGGDDGYWEGFRVRVTEPGFVTFTVDSDFDSFLDLFEIDLANPALNNLVAFDDDSGLNLNAVLTAPLGPDTEYWILVSGFGAEDVGSYTLDIFLDLF